MESWVVAQGLDIGLLWRGGPNQDKILVLCDCMLDVVTITNVKRKKVEATKDV